MVLRPRKKHPPTPPVTTTTLRPEPPTTTTAAPTPRPPEHVNRTTPFRRVGNTDRESFRKALSRSTTNATPPVLAEADAIYDALAPHGLTRLGAEMAWIERSNETWPGDTQYYPRSYHNLWAVKAPDGSWRRYPSYEAAAKDWAEIVLGPTFAAQTTIEQFVSRYAPSSENDTQGYIDRLVVGINKLPLVDGGVTPQPEPTPQHPLAAIFGFTPSVSFGWRDVGGVGYPYGVNHGTTHAGQHTGLDISVPFNTPFASPCNGTVTCVGESGTPTYGQGCGYFRDTGHGGTSAPSIGVGNLRVLCNTGLSITFGHSRTSLKKPGERVRAGEKIGTTGGMLGPHMHLETAMNAPDRVPANDRHAGLTYWLVDPEEAIADVMADEDGTTPGVTTTTPQPVNRGKEYTVPGLGTIRLPFPLEVKLIPPSQTNQRPGIPMHPDRYVQHDTGNTRVGMGADAHARYLQHGAPDDDGNSQQLSYHVTVDDKKAIVLIPFDEVAWHGGDGAGPCNYRGISCELCVNADANHRIARDNAAILAAEVMNASGIISLKPHQACSGKYCPRSILDSPGGWQGYVNQVSAHRKERR